jgi:hypothetical protein
MGGSKQSRDWDEEKRSQPSKHEFTSKRYSIFSFAAKPHQIRVFSRFRENRAFKKKDLDNADSPNQAQDEGLAAESIFKG